MARGDTLWRALAGDCPAPVEPLAERAAVCRAACHQDEPVCFGALDTARPYQEHDRHERRMGTAHRRLPISLMTLATVRRLKLPDLLTVVPVAGGPATPRAG